jgi:hypothetical protein
LHSTTNYTTALSIRDVDLQRDRIDLTAFLRENLNVRCDDSRFDWLYLRNPSGQARAWTALNEAGQIVGAAAAFPRLMWVDRTLRRGWVLGDLCVAPHSRSMGPALLLQRACLKSLATDEDPIWFDFPSRSMMAIYRRLGISATAHHVRYSKLFRIDKKAEKYISNKSVRRGVSRLANLALRFQRLPYKVPRGLEVTAHDGVFGEEFTALDSATADSLTIRGLRTAEYLNWRYLENPFSRYRVVVARHGAQLLGYAVLEISESNWILADFQAIDEGVTIPSLLRHLDRLAEGCGADSISAPIMESATIVKHFRAAGFYVRETQPIVTSAGNQETSADANPGLIWSLTHGDRES